MPNMARDGSGVSGGDGVAKLGKGSSGVSGGDGVATHGKESCMADAERERRHGGDAVASMGATRTGGGGWHGCTGEC